MRTKKETEAIGAALEAIAARNGGTLLVDDVIAEAKRNKSGILYKQFNWDLKKAAMEHWRSEARELIRSVKVVFRTQKTTITSVAYVRNPEAESDEQGYVSTISLIGEVEKSRAALMAEFTRAAAALRRARELAIVFEMEGEIEAVAQSVEMMRTKVEARVEQRQVQ